MALRISPIFEQPTEILDPLWRSEPPNQPTGLKDPRKHLRSSESISGLQVPKRAQRPQSRNSPETTEELPLET